MSLVRTRGSSIKDSDTPHLAVDTCPGRRVHPTQITTRRLTTPGSLTTDTTTSGHAATPPMPSHRPPDALHAHGFASPSETTVSALTTHSAKGRINAY